MQTVVADAALNLGLAASHWDAHVKLLLLKSALILPLLQRVCLQSIDSLLPTSAAAAAAKSLQSCPTLCDPIDGSPPGSPIPVTLQARTPEWDAISFSNAWKWKVKVKSLSHVPTLRDPTDCSLPGSSVHGILQAKEHQSGLPLPSPYTKP